MSMFKRFQRHSRHSPLHSTGWGGICTCCTLADARCYSRRDKPNGAVHSSGMCDTKQKMRCPACNSYSFFWKWQLLSRTVWTHAESRAVAWTTRSVFDFATSGRYLQFLDVWTGLFRKEGLNSNHTWTAFTIRYTTDVLFSFQTINQYFQTY